MHFHPRGVAIHRRCRWLKNRRPSPSLIRLHHRLSTRCQTNTMQSSTSAIRPIALHLSAQLNTRIPHAARLAAPCRRFSSTRPVRAAKQRTTPSTDEGRVDVSRPPSTSERGKSPTTTSTKPAQKPQPGPSPESPSSPLPYLPRPLGVSEPPHTKSKTWQEKKEELLDRDRHIAKRKAL